MKVDCCEEHVEAALDLIVDECETALIWRSYKQKGIYQQPVNIVET